MALFNFEPPGQKQRRFDFLPIDLKDFYCLGNRNYMFTHETHCPEWIKCCYMNVNQMHFFPKRRSDLNGLFYKCTVLLHDTELVSLPKVRLSEVRVGLISKH